MTIFDVIRNDHDKQRALVKTLLDTSGESSVRALFYEQLKDELKKHAVAEERHFYAPLMEKDSTIKMSRHGIAEHHQIDKLLASLDETEMSSPSWLATMKKLAHKIEHHLAEEEKEFFKEAGKALKESDKQDLADLYTEEMNAQ